MNLADIQRAELVALLSKVGPDAPTTINWSSYELASHLWLRENDLLSLPGIAIPAFTLLTNHRMLNLKERFDYDQLISRIKHPPYWSRLMSAANIVEFFVHRMDVLRADPKLPEPGYEPRLENSFWNYVRILAIRLSRVKVGLVIERTDTGDQHRISRGSSIVTIIGLPSELIQFLTGRTAQAKIKFVGEENAISIIKAKRLSL